MHLYISLLYDYINLHMLQILSRDFCMPQDKVLIEMNSGLYYNVICKIVRKIFHI